MAIDIHNQYLENEVLSADPLKLVVILNRAAIDAVGAARQSLAAGDIRARSRQITRTWEVLHELRRSLDATRGGDIARSLGELYDYMQRRLNEANAEQTDAPLAEVEGLLQTVLEGWCGAIPSTAPPPAASGYEGTTKYVSVNCAA